MGKAGKQQAFCPMCGTPSVGPARFCRSCGTPLDAVAEPPATTQQNKLNRTAMIIALGALVAAASAATVLLLRPDDETVVTASGSPDGGNGSSDPAPGTDDEAESEPPTDGFHPEGVGPVRIGMTQREVEAALGASVRWEPVFEDRGCSYIEFPPSPALSDAADPDRLSGLSGEGFELGYLEVNDYEQVGLEASTVEGVSLGDPESRVAEVYDTVTVETRPYGVEPDHWLIVPLPGGTQYVFGTRGGVIDFLRVGRQPDVLAIEGCV